MAAQETLTLLEMVRIHPGQPSKKKGLPTSDEHELWSVTDDIVLCLTNSSEMEDELFRAIGLPLLQHKLRGGAFDAQAYAEQVLPSLLVIRGWYGDCLTRGSGSGFMPSLYWRFQDEDVPLTTEIIREIAAAILCHYRSDWENTNPPFPVSTHEYVHVLRFGRKFGHPELRYITEDADDIYPLEAWLNDAAEDAGVQRVRLPTSFAVQELARHHLRVPGTAYKDDIIALLKQRKGSWRQHQTYCLDDRFYTKEIDFSTNQNGRANSVRDLYEIWLCGNLLSGFEEASMEQLQTVLSGQSLPYYTTSKTKEENTEMAQVTYTRSKVIATGKALLASHKKALKKVAEEAEAAVASYTAAVAASLATGRTPTTKRPDIMMLQDRVESLEAALKLLDHMADAAIPAVPEVELLMTDQKAFNTAIRRTLSLRLD